VTADALSGALTALVTGVTVYDGTVPPTPTYPYVLVSGSFPRVSARSQARSVHARQVRARTTIVGTSAGSVLVIAQKVTDQLEHAEIEVPGYVLGRVESVPNDQPILEDLDVVVNSRHPQYAVLDWTATASRTA
jgi:hypothetical protein